ncbi:MAG: hypothetical protein ABII80_02360 [bacterium]
MKHNNRIVRKEEEFLLKLERRAREQKKLVGTEVLPIWAKGMGEWLVVNPWRVLVPIAGIMYVALRFVYGTRFREIILGVFGGY